MRQLRDESLLTDAVLEMMMEPEAILKPVMAMALLTLCVALWMLFTRIPAMIRLKIHPQKGQDTRKLREYLPHEVNRVSNNYNHLFEQPVVFYAVCFCIAILGHVDAILVACAWVYVALRVVHSITQARFDVVIVRFYLFVASWFVLAVMIVREALNLF